MTAEKANKGLSLPYDLGDGLTVRWATIEDMAALADFNVRVHSDHPPELELWLGEWTRDLMRGQHPTTTAADFTVVVDEGAGGTIVSSVVLISQTWAYEGIPFGCGRIELVGTDDSYRRRGLIRAQFEAIHARSEARGELVQSITGIPWFYRRFGYEMTLNLGGARRYWWHPEQVTAAAGEVVGYRLRPSTLADIPFLNGVYEANNQQSGLITRVRSEAEWAFEMFTAHRTSSHGRNVWLIEDKEGEAVGYIEYMQWLGKLTVREVVLQPGQPWLPILQAVIGWLKQKIVPLNETAEKKIAYLEFYLGRQHPVYDLLDHELSALRPPYAWYMRVADLPAFLKLIGPVLAKRLAQSHLAGYTGQLKLSFYRAQWLLSFEAGQLTAVGTYTPKHFEDGDAFFPDFSFWHLLFGHHSLAEVRGTRADCFVPKVETVVLLNVLFPKRPSRMVPLG